MDHVSISHEDGPVRGASAGNLNQVCRLGIFIKLQEKIPGGGDRFLGTSRALAGELQLGLGSPYSVHPPGTVCVGEISCVVLSLL